MGDHRKLIAYRLASELAVSVYALTGSWPPFYKWSIGIQLVRAAGSIGANIAEAEGRFQPKDRAHFLLIARGSLRETRHWLSLAKELNLTSQSFEEELDEIGKTLNGLISKA